MKVCLTCLERFDSSRWSCPKCASCPESKDGFISFASNLADENGGFSPHYFSQLSDVELNHFWFEARNELIQWALRRYFPAAQTFLEVGCGTGFVLAGIRCRYPAIRATGIDLFTEGLFFAQSRILAHEPHSGVGVGVREALDSGRYSFPAGGSLLAVAQRMSSPG